MKEYVSLTTAAMKVDKIHFYSDYSDSLLKGKDVSLSKSMINNPEYVTFIFLLMVGVIEI